MKSFDDWFREQGSSPKEPEQEVHYKADCTYRQEGNVVIVESLARKEAANDPLPLDLKWEVYEEIHTDAGIFTRIGDIVHCSLRKSLGPFDLTIEQINAYHEIWPHTYPEFKE